MPLAQTVAVVLSMAAGTQDVSAAPVTPRKDRSHLSSNTEQKRDTAKAVDANNAEKPQIEHGATDQLVSQDVTPSTSANDDANPLDVVMCSRHNQHRQQSLMKPAARTKGASWQGSLAQCQATGYVSLQLVADSRISVDDARLRPHLRERARSEERTRLEHQQQAIFRNQHAEALTQGRDTSMPTRSTAGGDKRKLRGIPVQARGVGSVIAGTQPEQQATRGQDDTPDDVATFLLHANARRRAA